MQYPVCDVVTGCLSMPVYKKYSGVPIRISVIINDGSVRLQQACCMLYLYFACYAVSARYNYSCG